MGLTCRFEVKVQNGLVVLLARSVLPSIVPVIFLVVLMVNVSGPARGVHVRRIKDNAIHSLGLVGKIPAVGAR